MKKAITIFTLFFCTYSKAQTCSCEAEFLNHSGKENNGKIVFNCRRFSTKI